MRASSFNRSVVCGLLLMATILTMSPLEELR